MKKLFLLLALLLTASFAPALSARDSAYAEEDRYLLTYYYQDTELLSEPVYAGETVDVLGYTTTKNLLQTFGLDLTPGTVYEWHDAETDEKVTRFVMRKDATLKLSAVRENATCTVEYRYDYFSSSSFTSETITYVYGSKYACPTEINGNAVLPRLYASPEYDRIERNELTVPYYLTEDLVAYVVLASPAEILLDGMTYKTQYAKPLEPLKDTQTHKFIGFYRNEERTEEFDGIAVNGLTLYTKWERIAYSVSIETKTSQEKIVSFDEAVLTETDLPSGYRWTVDGEEIDFPYVVDSDVSLVGERVYPALSATGQAEEKRTLDRDEKLVLIITAAVAAIGLIYCLIRFIKKRRKNRKHTSENDHAQTL